jgi:hypothetical protein
MVSFPIIVVADRGTVKTFKIWHTPAHGPRLELLEQHGFSAAHQSLRNQATDELAASPERGSAGQRNSIPENQSLEAETERSGIRTIAEAIRKKKKKTRPWHWYLAFPSDVHAELVERIPSRLRAGLLDVIKADLTRSPTSEIIKHLGPINGQA